MLIWAFLNFTRIDEYLVQFIACSLLTTIMTYANQRLSAWMRLFSKEG